MTEKDSPRNAAEQRFLDHFRQAPEYEKTLIERCFIRIKMGVPILKAGMLFRRELTLAQAKNVHPAGEVRS